MSVTSDSSAARHILFNEHNLGDTTMMMKAIVNIVTSTSRGPILRTDQTSTIFVIVIQREWLGWGGLDHATLTIHRLLPSVAHPIPFGIRIYGCLIANGMAL
jgi:hypothetical protein